MSGLAGIYNWDGSSVDPAELAVLGEGVSALGPDGISHTCDGSVGLVYRPFHTTPESHRECQPVRKDGVIVTFDGRLDNREDLMGHLVDPRVTDVGLVMASYTKWGLECLNYLVGDYALAVWDSDKGQLLLARDPFGTRGLFYHCNARRLMWASRISALLAFAEVSRRIDDFYIATYLSSEPDGSRSAFEEVTPVRPGHCVVVQNRDVVARRFYHIRDHVREIRYRSDEEYESHFRELFSRAVGARIRADRVVAADLSGGLDSSSIVGMADFLSKNCCDSPAGVASVSLVFDRATTADEREFIGIMERYRNRRGLYLRQDDEPALAKWPDDEFISFPNLVFCFGGLAVQLHKAMQLLGARVLLRGVGGDELFLNQDSVPCLLADYFRRGRLVRSLGQTVAFAVAERRSVFELFWNGALRPNLPGSLRATKSQVPNWLDRRFVARTNLQEIVRADNTCAGLALPSKRRQYEVLMRTVGALSCGHGAYQMTRGCLESRYPFLDRVLVEHMLSIPSDQICRPGQSRSIQRRALRGILPEAILARRSKRGQAEPFLMGISRVYPSLKELLADGRACALGYVDRLQLLRELEGARHGRCSDLVAILKLISVEHWLRALEGWRPSVELVGQGILQPTRESNLMGDETTP
jgi:asparagine synthase (glutamine-hydrolysing)